MGNTNASDSQKLVAFNTKLREIEDEAKSLQTEVSDRLTREKIQRTQEEIKSA